MKKAIFGLFLVFFLVIRIQAQNDLNVQFIWSNVDTPLLSKPNIKSEPIAILKPGSQLKIVNTINSNQLDTLFGKPPIFTEAVTVPMNWVNVKFGSNEGYIKDTYLLDLEFRPNCTLEQFINEISIQIDTISTNNQCSIPDKVIKCESGIVYKSVCREIYGEVELIFNGWTIKEALVFLDRFEKISKSIKHGSNKFHISRDKNKLYLTDNMYSYNISQFEDYIQIVITWSC
jgi:hypothetical protein